MNAFVGRFSVWLSEAGDLFSLGFSAVSTSAFQTILFWLVCATLVSAQPPQAPPSQKLPTPDELVVHVIPGGDTIKLDGILDEEVWKRAQPATQFWQRSPQDRAPATERTEVRVVQDEEALYFGILCFDSHPDQLIALDMRRDAPLANDDSIGLYLDTYHDHRNFYYFSTNPLGTRRDGIVTDARSYNTAWNGIWQAKARVTDQGWSAEYRIPFSSLRFGGKQPMTWGFNISRAIRRKQESDYWAPIPRELDQHGTWRGELFGHLTGIETSESYSKWEAEPYVLGGGDKHYRPQSSESKFDVGGDLGYDFTPNVRGDVSIRTDFAQVEADQEVVNFTRFPLFFPEQRDFFLENAGLFNVGYEKETMLFYSRRIGLSGGQEVPILAAAKLSGRVGPYSLGIMNVQTESTDLTLSDGASPFREPATNYTVARVKRDLFSNSSVGAILTSNQTADDYSRLIGFDGNFRFNSAWKGEGLLARTFNSAAADDDVLGIGRLLYSKQNIVADIGYEAIGPRFNPEMGFASQHDLRRSSADLGYTQWVNKKKVRSIGYTGSFVYDSLYDYDFYSRRAEGGVTVKMESNDNVAYTYRSARERTYDPFTVGPITIGAGDYANTTHDFSFQSDASRQLSFVVDYSRMDYWTGKRQQELVSSNFHPLSKVSLDLVYTHNTVTHPAGSFETTTFSNRILYTLTTDFFVKSYVQWNNLEERFSANVLMGWEYRPGSNVYLVYNEIQDRFESRELAPRDRMLLLKWIYNLRF